MLRGRSITRWARAAAAGGALVAALAGCVLPGGAPPQVLDATVTSGQPTSLLYVGPVDTGGNPAGGTFHGSVTIHVTNHTGVTLSGPLTLGAQIAPAGYTEAIDPSSSCEQLPAPAHLLFADQSCDLVVDIVAANPPVVGGQQTGLILSLLWHGFEGQVGITTVADAT